MDFFQIVSAVIFLGLCYLMGRLGVRSSVRQLAQEIQKMACARILPLLEEARTALSYGTRNEVRRALDEIELYLTNDVEGR